MAKTKIEWTDYSWPVINGCRKVSSGCENCYAERLVATRLRHLPRYKGLAVWEDGKPHWTGESRLDQEELRKPFSWTKPRRIFVCEMGDLFFEGNSFGDIAAVFGVMAACPQHTFLVLTKRPKRAAEWFQWVVEKCTEHSGCERDTLHSALIRFLGDESYWQVPFFDQYLVHQARPGSQGSNWPPRNIQLGVTIENQEVARDRLAVLGNIPATNCSNGKWSTPRRWVSAEPLLGPVDLFGAISPRLWAEGGLGWVVIGCESGPKRRPCKLEWVGELVDQCSRLGVPVFVKQLNLIGQVSKDPSEWPTWLRRREYP